MHYTTEMKNTLIANMIISRLGALGFSKGLEILTDCLTDLFSPSQFFSLVLFGRKDDIACWLIQHQVARANVLSLCFLSYSNNLTFNWPMHDWDLASAQFGRI